MLTGPEGDGGGSLQEVTECDVVQDREKSAVAGMFVDQELPIKSENMC